MQQNMTKSIIERNEHDILQVFSVIEQYKSFCEFFRIEKLKMIMTAAKRQSSDS